MLVIKIELHSAVTGGIKTIGEMVIANDGTSGDFNRGNYDGVVLRQTKRKKDLYTRIKAVWDGKAKPTREGRVENYPRNSVTVWHLVARMLKDMDYH